LLRKSKNKYEGNQLPTVEEFLQFRPRRLDFKWISDKEGLVELEVPKFKSKFGKYFCNLIKKKNTFSANMDKIGSLVWINCDGKNTVRQILEKVNKEFPEEINLDQRLFSFIQQMVNLEYIDY
jgi:hypothetical protein